MNESDVVRMARQRAGLTQAELAVRSGFPRESIARWETRKREPSLRTVRELLLAAGFELELNIVRADSSLAERVSEQLALRPLERLCDLLSEEALKAVIESLSWLSAQESGVVIIGQVGAALQGAPPRLGSSTVEVVTPDDLSFAEMLERAGFDPVDAPQRWAATDRRWPWVRGEAGVSIASELPGADGFRDLRRAALEVLIDKDAKVNVAHPRDLLRLAEASARPDERARIPGLRALLSAIS